LINSQVLVQAGNSVAPISVAGIYSIINTIYNKPGSTLTGTNTNSIDYFQFINADKFITQGGTSSQYVMGDGSLSNGFTGGTIYKVYSALISQSSTSPPTVTIKENTLGYTPSLSRNLAGQYEIGVTGTTIPMYSITENTTNINSVFRMVPSFNMGIYTIAIITYLSGVATDGLLSNTPIEIKVYN
jgi:hypothetical protein